MSKLSRMKGKKWERVVAQKLRPIFGPLVKRGIQSRDGREVTDVEGTPLWIECKHAKVTADANPYLALEQGCAATDGRPVVAFCKIHGHPPLMAVAVDFGLDLLRAAQRGGAFPSILRVSGSGRGTDGGPPPGRRRSGRPQAPRAGAPPARRTPRAPPAPERAAGAAPPPAAPEGLPPPPPPPPPEPAETPVRVGRAG